MFTSNRHTLHNNEARSFNMMSFRTQDDAPFFSPRPAQSQYVSATVPVIEKEGCERVTTLMLRSNAQVFKMVLTGNILRNNDTFSGSNMRVL